MPLRPSLNELKKIWLNAYARSALQEAEDFIYVVARSADRSPEQRAAVCAAIIAYARPFTQSQVTSAERVVPLAGVAPVAALAATHEMMLNLRHKVVGHKDGTPAKGHSSTPNVILIDRDATGFNLHTVMVRGMANEVQEEVRQLCRHFVGHCEATLAPLIQKFGPEITKVEPGQWELVVTDAPADWIKPWHPGTS